MRKMLFVLLTASGLCFAGCLTVDSLDVVKAACESGTCSTGPGVIGSAEFRAMLLPSFLVTAHNSCKTAQPLKNAAWEVEVAFYDKDNFRIAIGTFYVGSLSPGEKVKHAFEIPDAARVGGPVVSIKVRTINETAVIPGQG